MCPTCYLKTFSPDWDKLNNEFDLMLKDLFEKKEKEVVKDKVIG